MELDLYRYGSTPRGTFGELHLLGYVLQTVERPYLGNAPRISSVPAGRYRLEPHESELSHIGDTWALVNEELGVSHYQKPGIPRFGILMHIANHMHQLEGCVGVGKVLGTVHVKETNQEEWAVKHSGDAMKILRDVLGVGSYGHYINIKWIDPEKGISKEV